MVAILLDLVLIVLSVVRFMFPQICLGICKNNIVLFTLNGVGTCFVLLFGIMMVALLIFHIFSKKTGKLVTDLKVDILCIIVTSISLILAYL